MPGASDGQRDRSAGQVDERRGWLKADSWRWLGDCEAAVVAAAFAYERRRPESTTLYEGGRDNVETLYAAMQDAEQAIPKFVRKEPRP